MFKLIFYQFAEKETRNPIYSGSTNFRVFEFCSNFKNILIMQIFFKILFNFVFAKLM